MGLLYSHLLFRPPEICTYQCTNGRIRYVISEPNGLPAVHSTKLFWLQTSLNFRIPCAYIRNPNSQYVVIYAHTNAQDLGASIIDAHHISRDLQVDVIAFEYSGYGLSERPQRRRFHHTNPPCPGDVVNPSFLEADKKRAEPSEKAFCADIIAVYDYLTLTCCVDPDKILVFGRSIGSGPAIYCASSKRIRGLVLIAPIASAVRVPLKHLNVTIPFIDTFPNIDRAHKIKCPVLVIHGDIDDIVPKLHGEKLFRKLSEYGRAVSPLWIPNARHNNVVEDFTSLVFSRYLTFLDELKLMPLARRSIDDYDCCRRDQFRSDRKFKPCCNNLSASSKIPSASGNVGTQMSFQESSRRNAHFHSQTSRRTHTSLGSSHPSLSSFAKPLHCPG